MSTKLFDALSRVQGTNSLEEYVSRTNTVNDKANSVQSATKSKQKSLGILSPEDELRRQNLVNEIKNLRTQRVGLEADAKGISRHSDTDALMSDETADTLVGGTVNVGGALVHGLGALADSFTEAPEFISEQYDKTIGSLDTLARNIPGYEALDEAYQGSALQKIAEGTGDVVDKATELFAGKQNGYDADFTELTDPLYNQTKVNQFAAEAGQAFEDSEGFIEGVGNMLVTAKNNPVAAAEQFAQSLPQMVALAKNGMQGAATFIAITGENARESTEIFEQKYGRKPNTEESATILGTSVAATLIDTAASKIVLGKPVFDKALGTGPLGLAVNQSLKSLAANPIVSTTMKAAAAGVKTVDKIPLTATVARGAKGGAAEPIEEGSQTILAELGGQQDLDVLTDKDVQKKAYVAGTLGLGSGVVGGTGAQAVKDLPENIGKTIDAGITTKDAVASTTDKFKSALNKDKEAVITEAVESNDPDKVINTITNLDITELSADKRKEHLNQLRTALIEVSDRTSKLEGAEQSKALEEDDRNTEIYTDMLKIHKSLKDKEEHGVTTQEAVRTITAANETDSITDKVVERTLASMQTSNEITEAEVDAILESKIFQDVATKEQVAQVEQYKESLKTLSEVSNDIAKGSEGFKGITEQLETVQTAVNSGDIETAKSTINELSAFQARQEKKLNLLETAVASITDSSGKITGETTVDWPGRKKPYFINARTPKFIAAVKNDIAGLKVAKEKAQAAYNEGYPLPERKAAENLPVNRINKSNAAPILAGLQNIEDKDITPAQVKKRANVEARIQRIAEGEEVSAAAADNLAQFVASVTRRSEKTKASRVTGTTEETTAPTDNKVGNYRDELAGLELSNPAAHAHRQKIIKRLEDVLNAESKTTLSKDAETWIKSEVKKLRDSETDKTVEFSAESAIAESILVNGLKATKQKLSDEDYKHTSDSLLQRSTKKLTGLLNVVPDLFNNLTSDKVTNKLSELSEPQTATLTGLQKFNTLFTNTVLGDKATKPLLKFLVKNSLVYDEDLVKDPLGYLIQVDLDGNRTLNKNLLSAAAISSYNWLGTQGSRTLFNDDEAIRKILRYEDNIDITPDERELLQHAGTPRNSLAELLGNDIYKQLGLQTKVTTDGKLEARLKLSLGELAITAMLNNDFVSQKTIEADEFKGISENNESKSNFIKVNNTKINPKSGKAELNRLYPSKKITYIRDSLKDGKGLLESLFGVESYEVKPLTEKSTHAPKKQKGTNQNVPKDVQDTIVKMQAVEWSAKQNMFDVIDFLGEADLLEINGYNNDIENTVHISEQDNAIGKNEALEREIGHIFNFQEEHADDLTKSVYFQYEAWKNGRIGDTSNTISLQKSKIHRHVFGAKAWETTIDTAELRDEFRYAIGLAFGLDVDSQPALKTLLEVELLINNETVQAGVEALKAVQEGNGTAEHKQLIKDAISHGGEGMHTLDALIALTQYHPTKPFTTNLANETDGKTSGIIIGTIQAMTGADDLAKLNAGGVFTDLTMVDYGQYKDEGGKDSYERLAIGWRKMLQQVDNRKDAAAVNKLVGSFLSDAKNEIVAKTARNLSKNPLMITNYGSAVDKVIEEFSNDIIKLIYSDVMKHRNDPDKLKVVQTTLNGLLGISDKDVARQLLNAIPGGQKALNFELSSEQINLIKGKVTDTYGVALKAALDEQFGDFVVYRKTVNDTMKVMFNVFKQLYDARVEQAVVDNNGKALTENQKKAVAEELQAYQPTFKGPLSENRQEGILGMKTVLSRTYTEDNQVTQVYNEPVKNTLNINTGEGTKQVTGTVSQREYKDGGVAPMILAIHSIDSAVIQGMLKNFDALNVFDAGYYKLDDVVDATTAFNKSWIDVNEQYSILEAVHEAFVDSMAQFRLEDPAAYSAFNTQVQLDYSAGTQGRSIEELTADLSTEVSVSKENRDKLFTGPINVAQMPHPGATYTHNAPVEAPTESEIQEAIDKLLQSIPDAIDFDNFNSTFERDITSQNTVTVFNELKNLGNVKDPQTHTTHLKSLLTDLVNRVLNPAQELELKLKEDGDVTYGAIKGNKVYINSAIGNVGNATQMSAQETYVHELVHAITREGVDGNFNIRKELLKVFREAKKVITWEDFMARDAQGNIIIAVNQQAEEAAAKARYEYIFENTQQTETTKVDPKTGHTIRESSNNFLHEFVAHGLTNQQLLKKLSQVEAGPQRDTKHGSLKERLEAAFLKLLDWLSGRFYGTQGLKADQALVRLVEEMTGIHTKNRTALYKKLDILQGYNEELKNHLNNLIFQPIIKFHNERLKDSKSITGRALKTITGLPVSATAENFGKAVKAVSRNLKIAEDSMLVKLVREGVGTTKNNIKWHSMLRYSKKYIDQARRHEAEEITAQIINTFHTEYTEQDSAAINRAVLKTDLVTLLEGGMDINDVIDLMENQVKLNDAISDTKLQLDTTFGNSANYYINQARGLGELMAQGTTEADATQMLNAHNIANMTSLGERTPNGDTKLAEQLIDQLATLYALDFTENGNKNAAARVIRAEYAADSTDNGILMTLNFHKGFKENALNRIFSGKKGLMIKGYTHEIFNPNTTIRVGTKDDEATLALEGFTPVSELKKSEMDPNTNTSVLYISKNQSTDTYLKSIASLTDRKVKGTTLADAYINEGDSTATLDALLDRNKVMDAAENRIDAQFANPDVTKPNKSRRKRYGTLVPITNDKGATVGYRYMMSETNKVKLLEKDDRFDVIMGKMYGSIVDKANTVEVNRNVLKLAREDYIEGFAEDPAGFVKIGEDSKDERYKEIYNMMPDQMKKDLKAIWGENNMVVREELVDLIFGYRKYSLEEFKLFGKEAGKHTAQLINGIASTFFNINNFSGKFGQTLQEVVSVAKDNIVIKSGVVLLGNINSNNLLLYVKGVPLSDIVKQQSLALRALNDFMTEVKEKNGLERRLKTYDLSPGQRKSMEAEVAQLKDNIKNNPVKELVDEGIFQSITEDVNVDESIYGQKEQLLRKAQPIIDKIPGLGIDSYKQVYMTHDTAAYKLLLRGTQYSDFIARYALYQHNINTNKMPKDEALADIIETFVNYDIPTGREMQYINDVGLLMFTKFLFRIQKVIFKNFKEKPATSLAVYSLQEMFGDVSDIADSNLITSSIIGRLNTPLDVIDSATYLGGYELLDGVVQ